MIIDVQCIQTGCGAVREILTQFEGEAPACRECGSPTRRLFSLTRKGDDVSANHSSVLFRFNYMEPTSS